MKRVLIAMWLMIAAGCLWASPNAMDREAMAIKGYIAAIRSNNVGLRMDALHKVARLKSERTEADVAALEQVLKRAARNDENPLVRLNAQLTLSYLQDKALRARVVTDKDEDSVTFFNRLYREVNVVIAAK